MAYFYWQKRKINTRRSTFDDSKDPPLLYQQQSKADKKHAKDGPETETLDAEEYEDAIEEDQQVGYMTSENHAINSSLIN